MALEGMQVGDQSEMMQLRQEIEELRMLVDMLADQVMGEEMGAPPMDQMGPPPMEGEMPMGPPPGGPPMGPPPMDMPMGGHQGMPMGPPPEQFPPRGR